MIVQDKELAAMKALQVGLIPPANDGQCAMGD